MTFKKHESISPSHFEENAKWRKENEAWLEWSRNIALSLVEYMESNGLNRNGLAERLGVSPQYISKILSGKVNFLLKVSQNWSKTQHQAVGCFGIGLIH